MQLDKNQINYIHEIVSKADTLGWFVESLSTESTEFRFKFYPHDERFKNIKPYILVRLPLNRSYNGCRLLIFDSISENQILGFDFQACCLSNALLSAFKTLEGFDDMANSTNNSTCIHFYNPYEIK